MNESDITIGGIPINSKWAAADCALNGNIYKQMINYATWKKGRARTLYVLNAPRALDIKDATKMFWDLRFEADITIWPDELSLAKPTIHGTNDEYIDKNERALLSHLFLRSSLCYLNKMNGKPGVLVTKSPEILELIRGWYPIPKRIGKSTKVGHTSPLEISTEKFTVYMIAYNEPEFTVRIQDINLSKHSKSLLVPYCALIAFRTSWISAFRDHRRKVQLTVSEPDGSEITFITTLNPRILKNESPKWSDCAYKWKWPEDEACIILPNLSAHPILTETKTVNIFQIKNAKFVPESVKEVVPYTK